MEEEDDDQRARSGGKRKKQRLSGDDGEMTKLREQVELSKQQRLAQKALDLEKKSPSKKKETKKAGEVVKTGKDQPTKGSRTYDNVILDCDGVLWHGDKPVEGSIPTCLRLSAEGYNLHFVTNSSCNARSAVCEKLRKFGLKNVKPDHITTSGSAAASFVRKRFPAIRTVYVVGEQGLVDELKSAGLACVGGPADNEVDASTDSLFLKLDIDSSVQAVVCGLDRKFNYAKLSKASLYLQKGCPLIGCNRDAFDVLPSKGNVPGAGCMLAALTASHEVEVTVVGKPSVDFLRSIVEQRKMDLSKTVMVGDRVDTDIMFAVKGGVDSCLVLTGVSSEASALATYCCKSLLEFANKYC